MFLWRIGENYHSIITKYSLTSPLNVLKFCAAIYLIHIIMRMQKLLTFLCPRIGWCRGHIVFSSPEQRSWRAIVLPPMLASASTYVKVFVKVFKTSLFPNLITDLIHLWYDDNIGPNFVQYHPHHSRSCEGQDHRLRIFMLKFYVKVFRISLLLHWMDFVPIWYYDRHRSKVSISTISTHDRPWGRGHRLRI